MHALCLTNLDAGGLLYTCIFYVVSSIYDVNLTVFNLVYNLAPCYLCTLKVTSVYGTRVMNIERLVALYG